MEGLDSSCSWTKGLGNMGYGANDREAMASNDSSRWTSILLQGLGLGNPKPLTPGAWLGL